MSALVFQKVALYICSADYLTLDKCQRIDTEPVTHILELNFEIITVNGHPAARCVTVN